MTRSAALLLALLPACSTPPSAEEEAAVYDAFLGGVRREGPLVLQETAVPVSVRMLDPGPPGSQPEISRDLAPEVREALGDLVERSGPAAPLPPALRMPSSDTRISERNMRALREHTEKHRVPKIARGASAVRISRVGFDRTGTVAVVYHDVVCGWNCGGASVRVLRRHPGGWLAAEEILRGPLSPASGSER